MWHTHRETDINSNPQILIEGEQDAAGGDVFCETRNFVFSRGQDYWQGEGKSHCATDFFTSVCRSGNG
jgi:hypothetical protein